MGWSPLGSGYLAGKYTPGTLEVQGSRSAEGWGFQSRFFAPNHAEILHPELDQALMVTIAGIAAGMRNTG